MNSQHMTSKGTPPAVPSVATRHDHDPLWRPWTPIRPTDDAALVIEAGEGYRVRDTGGTWYIDALSGALNTILGYGHPALLKALESQVQVLPHFDLSVGRHEPAAELAERLAGLMPGDLNRVFLANSGSEGIEAAIRMALDYWVARGESRQRVISFAAGYHGSTLLAQHLSGLPFTGTWAEPFPVSRVELPLPAAELRTTRAASLLLDAFEAELTAADDVAAVIVEPFINVGGGIVLPRGFLKGLRELCTRHGVFLVIDEVFCGMGRTGRMFGFEHEGITPDIVVLSKGLSGGYVPISAVVATDHVYETFAQERVIGGLRYGHTTSGHALACAAASAVLAIMEEEGIVANANAMGARLLSRCEQQLSGTGVTDVRGIGLITVVQLEAEELAIAVEAGLRARGVVLRRQGDTLMLAPPLIIDEQGVDALVERLEAELRAAAGDAG
ncbi:aminotransferase family protein [Streptomyces cyaneofuscatus]|uniref:aminotransferase family protein n=1 Tax=Streptomyces cyaneofuscatus TaxID=66883 RepID=UPI0033A4281E